ncbi:MAG: hypothetical protein DRI90_04345 [Deltaproteobacteria bacterium]|nr:MAG: hypothetical protein DRI90_04345 [Deltaproteobacteria bacterium]
MKYLYGDGTASPLDINYVEFLRDVLDFSVTMLMAADVVTKYRRKADERDHQAAGELRQLRTLDKRVNEALDDMTGLEQAPMTENSISVIRAAGLREVRRTEHEVQETLTIEREEVNRAIATERARNHKRLETLLLRHDLPNSDQWVNVKLGADNQYEATLEGRSTTEVTWVIELDIPTDHLFGDLVRLDRIRPQLSIQVPEEAGWVRKRVKLSAYKLSNKYVVAITQRSANGRIKLRTAPQDSDVGLDITFGAQGQLISLARLTKDGAALPFEPEREDRNLLEGLWQELSRAAQQLAGQRRALGEARLDDTPLEEHTNPVSLVKRLVAEIAPVVREISSRSLSPGELVLKRVLGDDRREEVFVSKGDLLEKLAPLSARMRRLFDPLGLVESSPPRSQPAIADPEDPEDLADTARRPPPSTKAPPPPRRRPKKPPASVREADRPDGDSVEVALDELE